MAAKRKTTIDIQSRRILEALARHPKAELPALAAGLGMTEEVVAARIARMQGDGVLRGWSVQVDAARLGMPHEILVLGSPSAETTREALESLCGEPGVTRVFTLASRHSVAFTVRGDDVESMQDKARGLATKAGLTEAEVTLIVDTLHDDPGAILRPAA